MYLRDVKRSDIQSDPTQLMVFAKQQAEALMVAMNAVAIVDSKSAWITVLLVPGDSRDVGLRPVSQITTTCSSSYVVGQETAKIQLSHFVREVCERTKGHRRCDVIRYSARTCSSHREDRTFPQRSVAITFCRYVRRVLPFRFGNIFMLCLTHSFRDDFASRCYCVQIDPGWFN